MTALVLVAHGSANAESNAVTAAIARRCAAALPGWQVVAAYLDHAWPPPADALRSLARTGEPDVVVVPLLFTEAYHLRVDLPRAVAAVASEQPRLSVHVTGPLVAPAPGPDPLPQRAALYAALDERLAQALASADADALDALVLTSAGTSDAAARATIARFARGWSARHSLPVVAAFASAAAPDPATAVATLRSQGARRVAVGSLFLGPGTLPDRGRAAALAAGAVAVADPLGDCDAVATVVLARVADARPSVCATPTLCGPAGHAPPRPTP